MMIYLAFDIFLVSFFGVVMFVKLIFKDSPVEILKVRKFPNLTIINL